MVQSNANHEANQVITKEERKKNQTTLGESPPWKTTTTKERKKQPNNLWDIIIYGWMDDVMFHDCFSFFFLFNQRGLGTLVVFYFFSLAQPVCLGCCCCTLLL
jgi:hypothetical protein